MEAQRASADLAEFMGLGLQWDKQIRLGARVGPAGLEDASTIRMKDSTTATEEFQSGRLGPSDRYLTPRSHDSFRMRSGPGQVELEPTGR